MIKRRWTRSFGELWALLRESLPADKSAGKNDMSASSPNDPTPTFQIKVPKDFTVLTVSDCTPANAAPDAPTEHVDTQGSLKPKVSAVTVGDTELVPASSVSAQLPGTAPAEFVTPQDAESAPTVPIDSAGRAKLDNIRFFASWIIPDGKSRLKCACTLFNEEYPGNTTEVEKAIANGRHDCELCDQARKLGLNGTPEQVAKEQLMSALPPDTPLMIRERIRDYYEKGLRAFERDRSERDKKKRGEPLSQVQPPKLKSSPTVLPGPLLSDHRQSTLPKTVCLHLNDLRNQKPQSHWQLNIDETGDVFDETANQFPLSRRTGRFVGLLVSADKHVLPALDRGWHAVDCTDTEGIDRVVQAVLDAPVGVFGIDVRSLPMTHGERWLDGVALLIDWTLRLMPVDAQCTLQVKVEQRGVFSAGQSWDVVRRECLRRLALAYPHRASRIDLQIEVVLKTGTPLNGYVDAIAFTWAGSTDSSKARLKFSGWEGTCLLNSSAGTDARTMLYAWDAFAQGVNLPPGLWWDMVCSSDARNPAAFMPALLNLVGNETITLPSVWAVFLAEVKARMAATPVDLQGLAAAVDWLQRYQPADATILPAMRLIWLTVQLAHANHTGRTEQQWQAELERLGDQLLDESAPLVCHADLHRAVAATNRYDIQGARSPNAGMKMG